MKVHVMCLLILLGSTAHVPALDVPVDMDASLRRYAAVFEATVSSEPAAITLHLLDAADNLPCEIRRRLQGTVDWGLALVSLPAGTTSWTDTSVVLNQIYDYQVQKTINATETAFGYLTGGIEIDKTDVQGRMILLIDASITTALAPEISRLELDLAGDGWLVTRIDVPRVSGWSDQGQAPLIRQQIIDAWTAAPGADKPNTLFILGHVPVPRSGLDGRPADGHDEHRGANAADSYYADLDGIWTDTGTAPAGVDSDHENVPDDGRFDQDYLPSSLELAFGRVDMADLGFFAPLTEVDLLRIYLDKLHAYRHLQSGYEGGRRSLFAEGYVESVEMTWRTYPGITGSANTEYVTRAELDAGGGPVNYVSTYGPYLIFAQNQVGPNVANHDVVGSQAVVWSSDQSGFGLWARPGNEIRAVLATSGVNLAWVWHVSPSYVFSDVAMGGTLGEAVRRTAEHSPSNLLFERPERAYDDALVWNRQYITLHGDPTLRIYQVAPVANLVGAVAADQISLGWTASPEAVLEGYHVYRSASLHGPYDKLTTPGPVAGTVYVDAAPLVGEAHYMVRAVKLQTTGGGTFLNPSQGVFFSVPAAELFADGFESGTTDEWS